MTIYHKSSLTPKTRVAFNPKNRSHMVDFAKFIKYNSWKDGCSYFLEDPYVDIPTMIRAKIADNAIAQYMEKC